MPNNPRAADNLIYWKPGQSGNPRGGSRKRSMRKSLRQATAGVLASDLPDEIRERIHEKLKDLDITGISDLIATRLALSALDPEDAKWMDAVNQLRLLENPEAAGPESGRSAPRLPTDLERKRQVAAALREAGQLEAKK